MSILAKLTTLTLIALLLTYIAIFYSPYLAKLTGQNIPQVTPSPTPTATATPTPTTEEKCIITLYDIQYDITIYRSLHTGGDVFKCGTDMTTVFQKRHPNISKYLEIMAEYKI